MLTTTERIDREEAYDRHIKGKGWSTREAFNIAWRCGRRCYREQGLVIRDDHEDAEKHRAEFALAARQELEHVVRPWLRSQWVIMQVFKISLANWIVERNDVFDLARRCFMAGCRIGRFGPDLYGRYGQARLAASVIERAPLMYGRWAAGELES